MLRLNLLSLLPCAAAAALCAAAPAQAASQVYDSEAAFLAAVGAVRTETFDRFTSDVSSALGASGNLGDFTVQGPWTVDAPLNVLDINGTTNLLFNFYGGNWGDLSFNAPIQAFGAWFNGVPPFLHIGADSLEGFGSYRHVATLNPTGSGLQFIGFTSNQTFNRLVFESSGCCSVSFALDNLSTAAALAPVPEPGSWALLGTGLLGLLAGRRRQTR